MLYTDMTGWVLSRAKGCPEAEVVEAMRNACMEFCTETRFMTEGVDVTTEGADLVLDDMDRQVLDVIEARIDDEVIRVTHMNDPDLDDLEDGEYALTFADPNHAQLTPEATPEAPVTITLILTYAPGPTSTEVSDLLWLRHSEALKHGALARVLEAPGKTWSNPQTAGFHRGKFEAAMSKTATDVGRNRQTTARRLRVRPVDTGCGRSSRRT